MSLPFSTPAGRHPDKSPHPTLFTEGVRLSPGQENVLVALDYLDAVPAEPQDGRTTNQVAAQAGMNSHVVRARLVDLRQIGFVVSANCPHYLGELLADAETRYAHYLTPEGYRRSRWAVASRSHGGAITGQEHRLLARLYLAVAVPTDRLAQIPDALATIGEAFRTKTGQAIADAALLRHMITSRKQGHWPRLGRGPRDAFCAAAALSDEQMDVLRDVYQQIATPTDALLTSIRQGRALARAFAAAAGERQPVRLLVASLMADRKAGHLPRLHRPEL